MTAGRPAGSRRRPPATRGAPLSREALLAPLPPALRRLTLELRRRILAAAPTLEERVLPGWKALGFRDPHAGHICALFPLTEEVRLYFEHGATLEDPDHLLEGNLKQTRFLRLRTARDLKVRPFRRLVRRAVAARSL